MKIHQIKLNQIKLDPNQPRKFIDEARVSDIAVSMKRQGVINPIEIDKDYVIVTGEMRYRAAKEAGFETVPCKMIEIGDDRFERQVIENIHHNTMSHWDTIKALKKLMDGYGNIPVKSLGRILGKDDSWLGVRLNILKMSSEFQQAVKDGHTTPDLGKALKLVPKEFYKIFEQKIINKQFSGRQAATYVRDALIAHPEMGEEILGKDYSNKSPLEVNKMLPSTILDKAVDADTYFEKIERQTEQLLQQLNNPPEAIAQGGRVEFSAKLALGKLSELYQTLGNNINNQLNEPQSNSGESRDHGLPLRQDDGKESQPDLFVDLGGDTNVTLDGIKS